MESLSKIAAIRGVAVVSVMLGAAGCSAPRAVPVECGKNLRPINVRPANAEMPSTTGARAEAERGS